MGMESRRYGYRVSRSGTPPAIKALIIANCAVFVAQTFAEMLFDGSGAFILRWFGLVPRGVVPGLRIWQPFTYLFLHFDIWHLLINMFVLWMFGRDLEQAWGRQRFLTYYLVTGVGAGLINVVVKTAADPAGVRGALIPTIGASGAIYGILMAAAILFPDRQVWMFPFPGLFVPMRVFALIWGAIEFFGTLRGPTDNVSHIVHLSGMLVGWLYLRRGSFFFGLRNRVTDWRRQRLRKKFEVYMRDHDKGEPPSRPDRWVN